MKVQFLIIYAIVLLGFITTSCGDLANSIIPSPCVDSYSFHIDINLIPQKPQYAVGDTIHVCMVSDNTMLYDEGAFRTVSLENFDPILRFMMPTLDAFPSNTSGLEHAELLVPDRYNHVVVPLDDYPVPYVLAFEQIDVGVDSTSLAFSIVLKETGMFSLAAVSSLYLHARDVDAEIEGKCQDLVDLVVTPYFNNERRLQEDILSEQHLVVFDSIWRDNLDASSATNFFFEVVE